VWIEASCERWRRQCTLDDGDLGGEDVDLGLERRGHSHGLLGVTQHRPDLERYHVESLDRQLLRGGERVSVDKRLGGEDDVTRSSREVMWRMAAVEQFIS
jgi:hypothetical protein